MRQFVVEAPASLAPVDRVVLAPLGRLGPALVWLATVQGAWPPHRPRTVRRVAVDRPVVVDGSGTAEDAFEQGARLGDEIADAGGDLLVLGADADQVAGVVVAAALLHLEPVQAVGTAGDAAWATLTVGVRDGLRATPGYLGDAAGLLGAVASPALSRLTGLLAQSAVRRTPVVLDGSPMLSAAALVAERLAPGGTAWWLAGQVPPNPAARQALDNLGLAPLLDLGLASAAGAELAWSVLEQAVGLVDGEGQGCPVADLSP
ncbi:MAG: nicotinate-nucleotide--dimethylbenzimidazole phosphoribosyltransferase [Mycobacteriales bacterium]